MEHPTARRVVEVATALVDEEGASRLTVRRLVARSGVSVGSVYHHVGDVESLLAAVASEALESWGEAFCRALQRRGIEAGYRADMRWRHAHPGLAELLDARSRGPLGPAARSFSTALRAALDARGLGVGAPPAAVAALVLGPLGELRRQERALGVPASAGEVATIAAAVEAGLGSMGESSAAGSGTDAARR